MSAISSICASVSLAGTFDRSQLLALPGLFVLFCITSPAIPESIIAAAARTLGFSASFDMCDIEKSRTICTLALCDLSQPQERLTDHATLASSFSFIPVGPSSSCLIFLSLSSLTRESGLSMIYSRVLTDG